MRDTHDSADAPDIGTPVGRAPEPDGPLGGPEPSGRAGPTGLPHDLPALRRRTTAVLIATQVLGGLGVATGVALAAVLAQEVSGSAALSGLASTSAVIGTALLSLPLASLMAARGRRPGLTLAYLLGAAGGAVVVLAAVVGSFPLLLLGMVAFGAGTSANLQARFVAADLALPHKRAGAISLVVWATAVGAVLGPNIAAPAGRSVTGLGIPETAGPFVWSSLVFLVAAGLVLLLLRPDPLLTARALTAAEAEAAPSHLDASELDASDADADEGQKSATDSDDPGPAAGRTGGFRKKFGSPRQSRRTAGSGAFRAGLRAVAASPDARLALVTITVAHTAMTSVMVMTPVDLGHHGASIQLIGLVISGHIAGMYGLSPLLGRLADRFGRVPVILLSVLLSACAVALAGTADGSHGRAAAGLVLLGLGWSAGLVAGSALLTESVPQEARATVQGLSDLVMNSAAAAGGTLAGLVVAQAGYGWLNAGAATLLVPVTLLALLALPRGRTRRGGEPSVPAPRPRP